MRVARTSASPLTTPQRLAWLLKARPLVSVELLALLASLFFAIVSNRAFWHAAREAGAFGGPNGPAVFLALFTLLVCAHVALLSIALHRATAKVVLTLFLVAAAVISYAATRNGAYLEPERMRLALQSNLVTSSGLGSWDFAATLVLQAGLPALLLWRMQVAHFAFPVAVARRITALLVVCAFASLAVGVPRNEIGHLVRHHKALRYLVTPANVLAAVALRLRGHGDTGTPPNRVVVPAPPAAALVPPQDDRLPLRREQS